MWLTYVAEHSPGKLAYFPIRIYQELCMELLDASNAPSEHSTSEKKTKEIYQQIDFVAVSLRWKLNDTDTIKRYPHSKLVPSPCNIGHERQQEIIKICPKRPRFGMQRIFPIQRNAKIAKAKYDYPSCRPSTHSKAKLVTTDHEPSHQTDPLQS